MDQELLLEAIQNIHLPDNYTRPPFLSRPDTSDLEKVIKAIPIEIESCEGTIDYIHPTKEFDRTVVALRLVERLFARFGSHQAAFWSVHEAIQRKSLVAFRRPESFQEYVNNPKKDPYYKRTVYSLRPLVTKFNPNKEPVLIDKDSPDFADKERLGEFYPEPYLELSHLRKLYESFVITHTPSHENRIQHEPDGPLTDDCSKFRFKGTVYEFPPSQADAINSTARLLSESFS